MHPWPESITTFWWAFSGHLSLRPELTCLSDSNVFDKHRGSNEIGHWCIRFLAVCYKGLELTSPTPNAFFDDEKWSMTHVSFVCQDGYSEYMPHGTKGYDRIPVWTIIIFDHGEYLLKYTNLTNKEHFFPLINQLTHDRTKKDAAKRVTIHETVTATAQEKFEPGTGRTEKTHHDAGPRPRWNTGNINWISIQWMPQITEQFWKRKT